uniref:C2H2-type domain-containing protein n=1 Tax=Octopus bimaculoides TaxID=37653 RepID=A0A0L8I6R6_OCTBM
MLFDNEEYIDYIFKWLYPVSAGYKKLLFGELQKGKRSQGGQKKRFKDTLKAFSIDHDTWERSALDRERIAAAEDRRQARKNRANNPVAGATIPCPHCQRLFRAQIGLTSHLRTHKTNPPPPQDD